MTQKPLFQFLLQALYAWLTVQLLLQFAGVLVTGVCVGAAGLSAAALYLLRYEPRRAAQFYARPGSHLLLHWLCKLTRQQPPLDPGVAASSHLVQLRTEADFKWYTERLKQEVFGHDQVLDEIVSHLKTNCLLRQNSAAGSELPPLGVFLLAGTRGIGKRWLASCVGQRLFKSGGLTTLDMREYADGDSAVPRWLGTPGRDGDFVSPVRTQPCHTLILENIEGASPKVHELLQQLLLHGHCPDGASGGPISLRNCLLFMTTTAVPAALQTGELPERERLTAALGLQTGCPASLFDLTGGCFLLRPLTEVAKAQVLLELMRQECLRYGLRLDYVEPELVVREVRQFSVAGGFEHAKIRLLRWLHEPIHLAYRHGLDHLVLTVDLVDQTLTQRAEPALQNTTLGPSRS